MRYYHPGLFIAALSLLSVWTLQRQLQLEQQWQSITQLMPLPPSIKKPPPIVTADQLIQSLKAKQLAPTIHYHNDYVRLSFNHINERRWHAFWSGHNPLNASQTALKTHYCRLTMVQEQLNAECHFNFH